MDSKGILYSVPAHSSLSLLPVAFKAQDKRDTEKNKKYGAN